MEQIEVSERELVRSLIDEIGKLPHARIAATKHQRSFGNYPIDAFIDLEVAGKRLQLLVEAKRDAFPRDVRELLWRFRNCMAHAHPDGKEIIPFLAAPAISRGARDLLREEGVGFYDLGGSLFIPSDALYILIDRPPPKRARRILSILEGQKARTIITLFAHQNEWIGVKKLAQLAEVSPATASATLSEMERREWVDVAGTGPAKVRRLRDATPLLEEWSRYTVEQKAPRIARYYVPSQDSSALCRQLDQRCRTNGLVYAVTGEAAAQHYAPHLTTISQIRCRMPPGRLVACANACSTRWRRAPSGKGGTSACCKPRAPVMSSWATRATTLPSRPPCRSTSTCCRVPNDRKKWRPTSAAKSCTPDDEAKDNRWLHRTRHRSVRTRPCDAASQSWTLATVNLPRRRSCTSLSDQGAPACRTGSAGTGDVDVVVDIAMLADTEAYRTLEENLQAMGFERAVNDRSVKQSWRWKAVVDGGSMILESALSEWL